MGDNIAKHTQSKVNQNVLVFNLPTSAFCFLNYLITDITTFYQNYYLIIFFKDSPTVIVNTILPNHFGPTNIFD